MVKWLDRSSDKTFTVCILLSLSDALHCLSVCPSFVGRVVCLSVCLSVCQIDEEARALSIKSTAVNFFGRWGNSGDEEDDSIIKPGGTTTTQRPTGEQEEGQHQTAQDDDSSVDSMSILVRESIESRAPMASFDAAAAAAGGKRLIEKVSIVR